MEADRPVIWISHKDGESCAGCGSDLGRGRLIQITREHGIRCLACCGLGDLVFLGSGDAALTRRATKHSTKSAVVVKFSRARKRNERQGVLVEEAAVKRAEEECARDAADRERKNAARREKAKVEDQEFIERFRAEILRHFPGSPPDSARQIARHACLKYSGRVGRSAAAKDFDPEAIELAVRAHIRHTHTDYDRMMSKGMDRREARRATRAAIEDVLNRWRA